MYDNTRPGQEDGKLEKEVGNSFTRMIKRLREYIVAAPTTPAEQVLPTQTIDPADIERIGDESNWSYSVIADALDRLEGNLSFEQFSALVERHDTIHSSVLFAALYKLAGTISFEQLVEIGDKSNWFDTFIDELAVKLEGSLSFEQALIIGEKSNNHEQLFVRALGLMKRNLTADEFSQVVRVSRGNTGIVEYAQNHLERNLNSN